MTEATARTFEDFTNGLFAIVDASMDSAYENSQGHLCIKAFDNMIATGEFTAVEATVQHIAKSGGRTAEVARTLYVLNYLPTTGGGCWSDLLPVIWKAPQGKNDFWDFKTGWARVDEDGNIWQVVHPVEMVVHGEQKMVTKRYQVKVEGR
jgi:hypothetical protein|tara:strand:- start:191 stop:640 length:450 start_codon:yes stop_codon:yes gene_type:complete